MPLVDSISRTVENPSVIIGLLSIVAGAFYYRLNNLEDPREREQYLVNRFEGRKWVEVPLIAEYNNIYVEETSGIIYKLRRLFLGELDGNVTLSVYTSFSFDEEMWHDVMFMRPYHRETKCNVEYVRSERLNTEKVQVLFKLDTLDKDEISHAISALLSYLKHAEENFDGVDISVGRVN